MKSLILLCALVASVYCNVYFGSKLVFEDGCIGIKDYWLHGTTTTNLCCDQKFDSATEISGVGPNMLPGRGVLKRQYMTLTAEKTNCHWIEKKGPRESF